MQRRRLRAFLGILAVLLIAGPVSAADFTGSEEQEQTLQCPAPGQAVPENQEPPGAGECDQVEETTYQGIVYSNNVQCASGGTDAGGLATIYHNQEGTTSGGVGVCNDGGSVPVQGRVVAEGSEQGGTVYADGDKDNANEQAQGYARVDGTFGPSAPTVRCGDAAGRKDASDPGPSDGQEDCG